MQDDQGYTKEFQHHQRPHFLVGYEKDPVLGPVRQNISGPTCGVLLAWGAKRKADWIFVFICALPSHLLLADG